MKLDYSKINKELPLLCVRDRINLAPYTYAKVPLNIVFDIPKGYAAIIRMNQKTMYDKGLYMMEGLLLVDSANKREVYATIYNLSNRANTLSKGDSYFTYSLIKQETMDLSEVDSIVDPTINKNNLGKTKLYSIPKTTNKEPKGE